MSITLAMRKELKLSFDGGDCNSNKCRVNNGVWRSWNCSRDKENNIIIAKIMLQ
jgi:hypothetical protein